MMFVKLIVLFCCVNGFSASSTDYCKICINHTLCKYKAQGPSSSCISYNSSAKLTNQDINELVNRINGRRNFVAMGYSKILPYAADMKKIRWSTELATFAQRWADQCDPAIHPDRKDQCRDLEYVEVGQNIGSVMGPSPGLSVKGFVEMWFIQVLDYTGSVTYYNKSRDYKSSYLTQLIWANTEFVGCGKAKFYVDERKIMLERLVCNFAPKGNIHGKPVYSIGYPATQCKHKMVPDDLFKGLCRYEEAILNTKERPGNDLLRILNLSNASEKHEIDPIHNNLKQSNANNNSSDEQRNQKTRHIITNKTFGTVKRIPQLRKQMFGNGFINDNMSRNNKEYHYQHDRGHSHLYHGHEPTPPQQYYEITKIINGNQEFSKYEYTTEPINSYSITNFRRFNPYGQCTRRIKPVQDNCASDQCTTVVPNCCPQKTMCPSTCPLPVEYHKYLSSYVRPWAITQQTYPPANCNYETTCPCTIPCFQSSYCRTTFCPKQCVQVTYQYNDMIPNIAVRSGNHKVPRQNSSQNGMSFANNPNNNKSYKTLYDDNDFDQIHKDVTDNSKFKSQEHDYLYRSYDSGMKKKRELENEKSVKPFWQIEDYNHQKPPMLKSMRFTTLPRINRKRKKMDSTKWLTSTEPITLRPADYADYQPEHVTEKYLSFDELMHLRKISDGFAHYDIRRQGKTKEKTSSKKSGDTKTKGASTKDKGADTKAKAASTKTKDSGTKAKAASTKTKDSVTKAKTTKKAAKGNKTTKEGQTTKKSSKTTEKKIKSVKSTTAAETTEYTANTPFERKKYCTRQLTCTWTLFTGINNNNENDDGGNRGQQLQLGSRTPPGYVDGCTRTSTCTRDYMDRNKISTITVDNLQYSSESTTPEDEDYCERRSLNIQRRDSNSKKTNIRMYRKLNYTNIPILRVLVDSDPTFNALKTESVTESVSYTNNCICHAKYGRKKREASSNKACENSRRFLSYNNLHHLILNKILKSNQANKLCPCNSSICSRTVSSIFLLLMFLNTFYL